MQKWNFFFKENTNFLENIYSGLKKTQIILNGEKNQHALETNFGRIANFCANWRKHASPSYVNYIRKW